MEILEFLNHHIIKKCVVDYNSTSIEKEKVKFNLHTLSNSTSYLENFHSDVIAVLLNPKGQHFEGNIFLLAFINYLNQYYELNINPERFQNAEVVREIGNSESHIDIVIFDSVSKELIIIENKINDAPDMDEQIDRYYRIATKDWKYQVRGIIYLTLDGVKQAPQSIEETKILTRNIGAFTNNHNDLVNGWLIPCFNTSNDIDNKSLINQYIKLIKHLANKNMDNMVMDEFYKFVNQSNSINTIDTIIELKRRIPEYRANNFVIAIGNDFLPFRNYFYYKPNYRLYDKFIKDDNCFKLDIWFNDDGSIGILFWNTAKLNDEGAETVHRILKAIGYENEFHQRKGSGYLKYFTLSEDYKTMYDIDIAAINFVKNFMTSLR